MSTKERPADSNAEINAFYRDIVPGLRSTLFRKYTQGQFIIDVDNVVQETAFRLFNHLQSLSFGSHQEMSSWCYRVAINLCRDELRRQRRFGESLSLDDHELRSVPGLGVRMYERGATTFTNGVDDTIDTQRAIQGLTPKQQRVLALDVRGHENEEIARMTGNTEGAIKSMLHRTRLSLKRLTG